MAEIAVSFVSEPNAESRIRRVSFPCVAKRQLHYDIRMSMDNIAFFACYLAPGNGVIALERRGQRSASDRSFSRQSDATPGLL